MVNDAEIDEMIKQLHQKDAHLISEHDQIVLLIQRLDAIRSRHRAKFDPDTGEKTEVVPVDIIDPLTATKMSEERRQEVFDSVITAARLHTNGKV